MSAAVEHHVCPASCVPGGWTVRPGAYCCSDYCKVERQAEFDTSRAFLGDWHRTYRDLWRAGKGGTGEAADLRYRLECFGAFVPRDEDPGDELRPWWAVTR